MPLHKFEDEVFYGLGRPTLGMQDILHDDETSPRKFTRTASFSLSPEMYQAAQEIVGHPNLPFAGNMSAMHRHALGNFLETVELFLQEDSKTIFRGLMRQQRRLTRERLIVTIEDSIEQQVDILRFWTAKAKWPEVVRTMSAFIAEVRDYPVVAWREHAASMWLRNAGLRDLLKVWGATMKEDSSEEWQGVERVYKEFEAMTGA